MDILIKGMKMPKNCDECRIMVFEDTNCAPELYCGCPIVFQAHPQGIDHRPDYCPLVPLPKHGRLIDADGMIRKLIENGKRVFGSDNIPECSSLSIMRDYVESAPTVIEAEEDTDIQKEFMQNWHEEDEW